MTLQQERKLMHRARVLDFLRCHPNKTDVEISKMADLSYLDTIEALEKLSKSQLVELTYRKKCSYTKIFQNCYQLTQTGAGIMDLPIGKRNY